MGSGNTRGGRARTMFLPCLGHIMRRKGATNMSLSEKAGCSVTTIQNMRNGCDIIYNIGCSILYALHHNEFKRSNQGAK